ncbi:MAG: class I tRNA ligase family protein, partial [Acidimicrobiia bacterium]
DPDAWKAWWTDPTAETYYFIGKDNIPFHAVFWPALLMGHGGLNLPTNVPANQYITFKGAKASKSMGVGRSIRWYSDRLEPDALRYAIASVLPEQNDTDLSDDQMIERINSELVATWGNLVNRVLSITSKHFDGAVPPRGDPTEGDLALIAGVDAALAEVGDLIEKVELRHGLRRAMTAAQSVNGYLNDEEPWKTIKVDRPRAATVLWTAIQAISGLRVAFAPYLPFTTAALGAMLGLDPEPESWSRPAVAEGLTLGPIATLFTKLEPDALDD